MQKRASSPADVSSWRLSLHLITENKIESACHYRTADHHPCYQGRAVLGMLVLADMQMFRNAPLQDVKASGKKI